jgi:hypothetical protein
MTFTREQGEINTYNDLSRLVQTCHDEEQIKRELSMAIHLELITRDQLEKLCGLFNFVNTKK